MRHFRFLLEGRSFHIETDHKPLTFALHRASEPWSARQQRQLSYLAEFTSDIRHVPGSQNLVADTLSRPPAGNVKEPSGSSPGMGPPQQLVAPMVCHSPEARVDLEDMARGQQACPDTSATLRSSSLQCLQVRMGTQMLWCDVSRGPPRSLVPLPFRKVVFKALHNIAHPGVLASKRLISARFVWKGMAKDITAWCRDCQDCARSKVTTHARVAVQPIEVPSRRFSHIHVDLVGPLPISKDGRTHLFTMVDRSTRWAEAVPVASTSSKACAEALFAGWIARFGVPASITSDRGTQFASEVWTHMCEVLGIQHQMTTAYHPQANGLVERFHRQLKNSLRALLCGPDWASHLPWVLLGLRAAPKEDAGVSSAELEYGSPLTLPGQFLEAGDPPAADFLHRLQRVVQGSSLPTRPLAREASSSSIPSGLLEAVYVCGMASSLPWLSCTRAHTLSSPGERKHLSCRWDPGR